MIPRCPPHACDIVRVSRPITVAFPPDRRADVGSAARRSRKRSPTKSFGRRRSGSIRRLRRGHGWHFRAAGSRRVRHGHNSPRDMLSTAQRHHDALLAGYE